MLLLIKLLIDLNIYFKSITNIQNDKLYLIKIMVSQDLKKFSTPVFPFTAIVGQEEMKLALQLNVIDPENRRCYDYGG